MGSISALTACGGNSQNMFSRIDANGDSTVSKEEFVSARPQDVSEEQAAALYDAIDTTGSNALTQSQLEQGMKANAPARKESSTAAAKAESSQLSDEVMSIIMQLVQQISQNQSDDDGSLIDSVSATGASPARPSAADMFASMDTDGDSLVTESEFIAAKPDDVTEEMARQLFSSIDSADSGSITQDQFENGFQGPPPARPAEQDETSLSALDDNSRQLLLRLLQAVQNYSSNVVAGSFSVVGGTTNTTA